MSAAEQKETFSETLAAALDTDCRFDVVQAVHENLRSRIEEHKEAKDPDALEITARDVVSVLRTSGVIDRLEEAGCGDGDSVAIYDFEFDFVK